MNPNQSNWNIVVNGTWNVAIFSPYWIGALFKELFGTENIDIQFLFGPEGPRCLYFAEAISVAPASQKLVVGLTDSQDHTLRNGERIVQRILDTLPHTPVTGLGINFGYTESPVPGHLRSLFDLEDNARLDEESYVFQRTTVDRAIDVEGGTLNVALTMHCKADKLSVALNFHHAVTDAVSARALLEDRTIWCRDAGLRFLETVYQLTSHEVIP